MGRGESRFEQVMGMLPEGWEAKAKELGALQRAREIKTPEALLRLILLYLTEGKSFAGTSALAGLSEEAQLSKVAVFKRIGKSGAWLQWMSENLSRKAGLIVRKPQWLGKRNVLLVDGSEVIKCGIRRQSHMLHYSVDLFTLAARELLVTGMKTGEKLGNYQQRGKRDIVKGDRAYGNIPWIEYLARGKAGYVQRIHSQLFPVYNGKGRKIDLLQRLKRLKRGGIADIQAYYVINGEYRPVRVCALRKDRRSERAGIKRLAHDNQRKRGGREVSKLQRENNKHIIVATSLEEEAGAARVLDLYRMRWQVELVFKRLKSLFEYNDLPAKRSESVKAWFYGKLLIAALCETLVNTGRFSPCGAEVAEKLFSGCWAAEFVERALYCAGDTNSDVT
jgi:hypothetical protein